MNAKTVLAEMPLEVAEWLQLMPATLGQVRIMGVMESGPLAQPNKVAGNGTHRVPRKVEYDTDTRMVCQHRPPESAEVRRKLWDHLRDKFGDMVISRKDATDSVVAAGLTTKSASAPAFTMMLRKREMRPVK